MIYWPQINIKGETHENKKLSVSSYSIYNVSYGFIFVYIWYIMYTHTHIYVYTRTHTDGLSQMLVLEAKELWPRLNMNVPMRESM